MLSHTLNIGDGMQTQRAPTLDLFTTWWETLMDT
jgi:hypothetical protein